MPPKRLPQKSITQTHPTPSASSGEDGRGGDGINRGMIMLFAWSGIIYAGYASITNLFNSIPQLLFFGAALSIGLGGFASLLKGEASIKVGTVFTATGLLAVLVFFVMLMLYVLGILKIPGVEFDQSQSLFITFIHSPWLS